MEKNPVILGLGRAVPARCYKQEEILDILQPHLGHHPRAGMIFHNAGIDSRYLAVDGSYYTEERTTQARNERYMKEAVPLAELALRCCLDDAGEDVESVTDLITVSCTGIDTPGLDLHLAGRLGLPHHLRRASILGMGCYGAFPGLLRAAEAASATPGRKALLVCVEICSLHFQPGDTSLENIVSSALFSDGAAAVLVGGMDGQAQNGSRYPVLVDSATYSDYTTFDDMAFHLTDHGFRMRLSSYVPRLLAANIEQFVDGLLERNNLSRNDVRHWGVHPGSSKILDHTQERLELPDGALDPSRSVLRAYGNMSSVTVLYVLEALIRQRSPKQGEYGMLMSFGPGLTMEGALVRW